LGMSCRLVPLSASSCTMCCGSCGVLVYFVHEATMTEVFFVYPHVSGFSCLSSKYALRGCRKQLARADTSTQIQIRKFAMHRMAIFIWPPRNALVN